MGILDKFSFLFEEVESTDQKVEQTQTPSQAAITPPISSDAALGTPESPNTPVSTEDPLARDINAVIQSVSALSQTVKERVEEIQNAEPTMKEQVRGLYHESQKELVKGMFKVLNEIYSILKDAVSFNPSKLDMLMGALGLIETKSEEVKAHTATAVLHPNWPASPKMYCESVVLLRELAQKRLEAGKVEESIAFNEIIDGFFAESTPEIKQVAIKGLAEAGHIDFMTDLLESEDGFNQMLASHGFKFLKPEQRDTMQPRMLALIENAKGAIATSAFDALATNGNPEVVTPLIQKYLTGQVDVNLVATAVKRGTDFERQVLNFIGLDTERAKQVAEIYAQLEAPNLTLFFEVMLAGDGNNSVPPRAILEILNALALNFGIAEYSALVSSDSVSPEMQSLVNETWVTKIQSSKR